MKTRKCAGTQGRMWAVIIAFSSVHTTLVAVHILTVVCMWIAALQSSQGNCRQFKQNIMYNKAIWDWLCANPGSSCVGKIRMGCEESAVVVKKEDNGTYEVGDLYDLGYGICLYSLRGWLFGLTREEAFRHACNVAGIKYTSKE